MRYDNDPRVTKRSDRYNVTRAGQDFVVASRVFGWCIFTGPNLDLVNGGFPDAEQAIDSLLNEAR